MTGSVQFSIANFMLTYSLTASKSYLSSFGLEHYVRITLIFSLFIYLTKTAKIHQYRAPNN